MRRNYLSSSQLWLGCMCSLATLSEPAWGSPIVYANSVGWLAEPAISSSRFLPGVTFGTVLSDRSSKDAGLLVLASGDGESDDDDSESDDDSENDDDSDSDSESDSDDDSESDDTGPVDTGPVDAGPVDAGPVDAGPVDAGPVDAGTPSNPTPGATPTVSGAPAGRPVSTDSAVTPRIGSGGGSWSGAVSSDDNPFEPYFENNVSPQNLSKILAYFGLVDRFAALPDDGQVDIVWLEFERKPSLKGLSVVIDGTAKAPDLSAVAGKLAVLVFLNQSTLTKGSDVVAVFGNSDVDGANMARRRPLR